MKHLEDQTDRFQITLPNTEREPHSWVDQDNPEYQRRVRRVMELEPLEIVSEKNPDATLNEYVTNRLPPGMFIDNQVPAVKAEQFPRVDSWATGREGMKAEDVQRGFLRGQMSMTEEDADHNQEFFDEAKGDDDAGNKVTGFVERRNVTDRN